MVDINRKNLHVGNKVCFAYYGSDHLRIGDITIMDEKKITIIESSGTKTTIRNRLVNYRVLKLG